MGGDPLSSDAKVEGQVVFVGFGVSAPEFGYDDYAGIDVRGKIVAALVWRSIQAPFRSRRPFFVLANKNCVWPRSMARSALSHLGGQGGTAHSIFRVCPFFEGASAALAG